MRKGTHPGPSGHPSREGIFGSLSSESSEQVGLRYANPTAPSERPEQRTGQPALVDIV